MQLCSFLLCTWHRFCPMSLVMDLSNIKSINVLMQAQATPPSPQPQSPPCTSPCTWAVPPCEVAWGGAWACGPASSCLQASGGCAHPDSTAQHSTAQHSVCQHGWIPSDRVSYASQWGKGVRVLRASHAAAVEMCVAVSRGCCCWPCCGVAAAKLALLLCHCSWSVDAALSKHV